MTTDVLLAAHDLVHAYGGHRALKGIDLELHRGEVLGFLGLNGAGKTTTLEILAGALAPDRGTILICGNDLRAAPAAARRALGYLPQSPPLHDDLRVDDYLIWCAHAHAVPAAELATALARARSATGLNDHAERLVGHLSGGYRQRLGLAQALLHDPAVLILDEPTAGLDPAQRRDVYDLLKSFSADRAVLISTHILAEVEALAGRAVILHEGRIVYDARLDHGDGAIKIGFHRDPDPAALSTLAGVSRVTPAAGGGWLLTAMPEHAVTIADHAVRAGWGVTELIPEFNALEQHFLQVTAGADRR